MPLLGIHIASQRSGEVLNITCKTRVSAHASTAETLILQCVFFEEHILRNIGRYGRSVVQHELLMTLRMCPQRSVNFDAKMHGLNSTDQQHVLFTLTKLVCYKDERLHKVIIIPEEVIFENAQFFGQTGL